MTGDEQRRVLTDGTIIPTLGLGVWQVPDGPECENAVHWALDSGYRHIDTTQVQFSPFEYRRALLQACAHRDVALEAYSPLGTGRHLSDPAVMRIAEQAQRTPAQVLIRWCLQRGTIVLPKSTHRERIQANAQVFDFELSGDQMRALDDLDHTGATAEAREGKWW